MLLLPAIFLPHPQRSPMEREARQKLGSKNAIALSVEIEELFRFLSLLLWGGFG